MSGPAKYRKKPVVIEAMQFTGENSDEIIGFSENPETGATAMEYFPAVDHGSGDPEDDWGGAGPVDPAYMEIRTLEGTMRADVGDWVIRGVKGEIYPCKPDIFDATYEPAGEVEAS